MSVHRCPRCRRHIQWLTTKFSTARDGYRRPARLPFDYDLVDVGALAGRDGWIAGKNSGGGVCGDGPADPHRIRGPGGSPPRPGRASMWRRA